VEGDDNAIGSYVGIGFDVLKTKFDSIRERLQGILGPITCAASMSEGQRSIVFKERMDRFSHHRTVDPVWSLSGKYLHPGTLPDVESADRFAILMSSDERLIAIDEAAFVLASHFHEGLVVEDQLALLDRLASGCGSSLSEVVTRVFGDLGFQGNTCGYYDQDNSCLDAVLERRLGIPITLSIVLMSIARRVGREMHGIGMPGHFLTFDVETGAYLDAFDAGQKLDEYGCQQLFLQLHGPDAPWHRSMLAPIGPRGIIRRMLNNLAQIAVAENDHKSRIIATRLRSLLPDASIWERAELARAYEASGDFERASCVLEAVAAEAPPEEANGFRFAAAQLRALLN